MSRINDDTVGDSGDGWLRALARTPPIAPFTGTERYRVQACLGEGGFGVVYDVEDRTLGRRLALKTLKPQRVGFATNIARLKREFRSVADLVHPNLVGLHELASDADRWFFTMDLVRGCDFCAYVRGESALAYAGTAQASAGAVPARPITGVLSEPRLRVALRQLVDGVTALHDAGIVHRDLKPSNVLVERDGRVVILDFGLAGGDVPGDPELALAGTPLYMAPEQAAGRTVTAAADWYAVGVMLHEALTGAPPDAKAVGPASDVRVPADLAQLCLALLDPDPAARPDGRAIRALLGESAAAAPHRGAEFIGRATELAALDAHYRAVRRGEPALVRISGQPGVGKSALLARFVEPLAAARDAVVLAGRCHERESLPFKAFDGVIDALVAHLQALPRNLAIAALPRDIHLATQLFPALDGVTAIHDLPHRPAARSEPRELRLRAFAAIKELFGRLADRGPVVIAIDDLQWGDADSARLLAHLLAPPERPGLLVVLAYRAEDSAILHETLRMLVAVGEPGLELALSPLPPDDAEALAGRLLGDASGAARAIAQRGEGHPLFIAELARAHAGTGPAGAAPLTLIDMLWQRVARLSDGARALLETIAVAGRPIASGLCFEAAGIGATGVDAMRLLRAEQLVRAGDRGVINVFHDRIRDAVLLRADASTQRLRHRALAHALERAPDSDPEVLARHFDAADDREPAARYAVRAGDAAMGALAFDRAAALYQMTVDRGGATRALYEKLGDAQLGAGRNADAGEAYLAAAGDGTDAHAIDLMRRGAEQMLGVGDRDRGYRALEAALAAVGESLPRTLGRAKFEMIRNAIRLRLGGMRLRERAPDRISPARLLRLDVLDSGAKGLDPNDPPRAMALASRFARLALATGEPRRAALGMLRATFCLCGDSRPPAALRLVDQAEAIGVRIGDPDVIAQAALTRGMLAYGFGDWNDAIEQCERAAAVAAEQCVGLGLERRFGLLLAGSSYIRTGRLAEARRVGEVLLLDAVERGDRVAEKSVCGGVLSELALADDDVPVARAYVRRSGDEERCVSVMVRTETGAGLELYAGDSGASVAAWDVEWQHILEMGTLFVGGFRAIAARSRVTALLSRAAGPGDLREADRMIRSLRPLRFRYGAAVRAHLLALRAMRAGRPDRVLAQLALAAAGYDATDMKLDAAVCRHRHGELAGGSDGAAAMAAAVEVLRAAGIAAPDRWIAKVVPALAASG